MRRREFLGALGAMAVVWPRVVHGQRVDVPIIGWLSGTSARNQANRIAIFREGLKEKGFVENQNVEIEYRWADGHRERLPELAAELVARRVALIVTGGGTPTALAAKAATQTMPIVFTIAADPIRAGLVRSLSHPEGNMTGIVGFTDLLIVKRLELMTELLPNVAVIGALINPANPNTMNRVTDLRGVATALRRQIQIVSASSEAELAGAFTTAVGRGVGALIVQNESLFNGIPDQLAALAMRHRLPAIFETYEHAVSGGLISYGPSLKERYHLLGSYAGRVLKGERPADLPIMQPTIFELVINAKTAKALGLIVPPAVLARADEVIE